VSAVRRRALNSGSLNSFSDFCSGAPWFSRACSMRLPPVRGSSGGESAEASVTSTPNPTKTGACAGTICMSMVLKFACCMICAQAGSARVQASAATAGMMQAAAGADTCVRCGQWSTGRDRSSAQIGQDQHSAGSGGRSTTKNRRPCCSHHLEPTTSLDWSSPVEPNFQKLGSTGRGG